MAITTPITVTSTDSFVGLSPNAFLMTPYGVPVLVARNSTDSAIDVWVGNEKNSYSFDNLTTGRPVSATYSAPSACVDTKVGSQIHIVFWETNGKNSTLRYIRFNLAISTLGQVTGSAFNNAETVITTTGAAPTVPWTSIACDKNGILHIAYVDADSSMGSDYDTVRYIRGTFGAWGTAVTLEGAGDSRQCRYPSICLDSNNYPRIAYVNTTDSQLTEGVATSNNPGSFTLNDRDTTVNNSNAQRVSNHLLGTTVYTAYLDSDSTICLWDGTSIRDTGTTGTTPIIARVGNQIAVVFEDANNDILYRVWNGSTFDTAVTVATGTYNKPLAISGTTIRRAIHSSGVGSTNAYFGTAFKGDGNYLYGAWTYMTVSTAPTNTENLVLQLWASTGTLGSNARPTGTVLATTKPQEIYSTDTSGAWRYLEFETPYLLTEGTVYCINSARIGWTDGAMAHYPAGNSFQLTSPAGNSQAVDLINGYWSNNGTSWTGVSSTAARLINPVTSETLVGFFDETATPDFLYSAITDSTSSRIQSGTSFVKTHSLVRHGDILHYGYKGVPYVVNLEWPGGWNIFNLSSQGTLRVLKADSYTSPSGLNSWSTPDSGNAPATADNIIYSASVMDDDAVIHIAYYYRTTHVAYYVTFDTKTDTYGTVETIHDATENLVSDLYSGIDITLDSNQIPHVVWMRESPTATSNTNPVYSNRIGGSWKTPVEVATPTDNQTYTNPKITLDGSGFPTIVIVDSTAGTGFDLFTSSSTDPSSFNAPTTLDASMGTWTAGFTGTSLGSLLDNNTDSYHDGTDNWTAFKDSDNSIKVLQGSTDRDTGSTGEFPQLGRVNGDLAIFYMDSSNNPTYQIWNGSSWGSATNLDTGGTITSLATITPAIHLQDSVGPSESSLAGTDLYTGGTTDEVAHSFVGRGGSLKYVDFSLREVSGTPTGSFTAYLYAHDGGTFGSGGLPTGSPLATSTNSPTEADTTGTRAWIRFNFNDYTLKTGTYYFIAVKFVGGNSGNYMAVSRLSDVAHAGNSATRVGGGSWTAEGTNEYNLRLYVEGANGVVYWDNTTNQNIYDEIPSAITSTQTQTGLSRITDTVLQTQTGIADIIKTQTQTQTGISAIVNTNTQTQTGVSRITDTSTQTQTGVADILKTATATQTGVSRVTATSTQTQSGISSIATTTTQTQTGIADVLATTTQTQTGVADILKTQAQTQTAISRITTSTTATQTGISRITVSSTQTQTGLSRITATTTQTQTGIADILATTSQTQTGVSRITISTTQTQTGVADILKATAQTQTGVARVTVTTTRTQTGISNIQQGVVTTTQTQTGISRISIVTLQTQTGLSRITDTALQTQTGVSRIQDTFSQTQTGVARVTTTSPAGTYGVSWEDTSTNVTTTPYSIVQNES